MKYRGYDSAGLAILDGGVVTMRRAEGRLPALQTRVQNEPVNGSIGIAHTRWATHGPPCERNAHPHRNGAGTVAVVHNGIIENHSALRRQLQSAGVVFTSDTDTEVIPHVINSQLATAHTLVAAVQQSLPQFEGAYAFAAVWAQQPDRMVVARQGSPLLIGRSRPAADGSRELLVASDVLALLPHATEMYLMNDGDVAELVLGGAMTVWNHGTIVAPQFAPITVTVQAADKGAFDSFMAKEIAEQPSVLDRLLESRLQRGRLVVPDLGLDLALIDRVVFLACGTSWHASLLAKRMIESLVRIPVEVDIASEYRYRDPVTTPGTLVVAISQSGETADTLAGVRLVRGRNLPVVALVNVVTSTIAREAAGVMPLLAGPEIGVASTKAYTAQMLALYLFALQIARAKGRLNATTEDQLLAACRRLPAAVERTLSSSRNAVEEAADLFAAAEASVFLGRGGEHATALEGALKLKEIAYVAASGYAAGEFKHGPIALVSRSLPVVAICPRDSMRDKMLSNVQEAKARAGRLIGVGSADDRELHDLCDLVLPIGTAEIDLLQPLLSILPLQRYALRVAQRRGCDVDQPRNLAKSVTVE